MGIRISELPTLDESSNGDLVPIVDDADQITKKIAVEKIVPDGSITTPKLADEVVETDKLGNSSVTAPKLKSIAGLGKVTGSFEFTGNTWGHQTDVNITSGGSKILVLSNTRVQSVSSSLMDIKITLYVNGNSTDSTGIFTSVDSNNGGMITNFALVDIAPSDTVAQLQILAGLVPSGTAKAWFTEYVVMPFGV